MAPPLYFFARKQLADVVDAQADRFRPALLAECHLADTFADVASVSRQTATNDLVQAGPGGFSGVITTIYPAAGPDPSRPGGDIKRTGYQRDFQQWKPAGPDLWIGVDKESPPRPDDLLRANAVVSAGEARARHLGYRLPLADGHEWEVPVIRRPDSVRRFGYDLTRLPMDIGWDGAGRFCETLKPEYEALWEDTAEIADLFFDKEGFCKQGGYEITIERALTWTLRILGLNYRYGKHEQNLLHLVDKSNVFTFLSAAVDFPLVSELVGQKKTESSETAAEPVSLSPG